jgi:hypothetical protein
MTQERPKRKLSAVLNTDVKGSMRFGQGCATGKISDQKDVLNFFCIIH